MPFQKGQSGNPAGRKPGSRNRATVAFEALLDGQAEALTQKAVELALAVLGRQRIFSVDYSNSVTVWALDP
jgi:hypothetical protein